MSYQDDYTYDEAFGPKVHRIMQDHVTWEDNDIATLDSIGLTLLDDVLSTPAELALLDIEVRMMAAGQLS